MFFGYVSVIKPEEFEGSIAPLCAQVVIKRPFKYCTRSWGARLVRVLPAKRFLVTRMPGA